MRKAMLARISALALTLAILSGCSNGAASSANSTSGPASSSGKADDYPNRPIHMVLPNGAGGSMENSARKWQPYFEKAIGKPLQIDFVEGSGTLIGTNTVAKAAPDGYTLLMLSGFDFCNTMVTLDAPYKIDDFEMLGINMQDPTAIMVRKDAPWNTLQELLDYMKTQPSKSVSMGLTNLACSDTLGVKELEDATGVQFNNVAFNSGSAARTALLGGQVQVGHFSLFGSEAILDSVKVLAIQTSSNPYDRFKGVPTVNEVVGKQLHDITSDYGVLAPAGFSEQYPDRAKKLIDAFHQAWTDPDFIAARKESGDDQIYNVRSPEDSLTYLKNLFSLVEQNKDLLSGGSK